MEHIDFINEKLLCYYSASVSLLKRYFEEFLGLAMVAILLR